MHIVRNLRKNIFKVDNYTVDKKQLKGKTEIEDTNSSNFKLSKPVQIIDIS